MSGYGMRFVVRLRMRQTESIHVAIDAAKGTKSYGGSWGIREYDVRVFPFTQTRKESANAWVNVCGIRSFAYRMPHAAYGYRAYGILA